MHAWINLTHPGFSGRQEMPDDGDQWISWEQMVAQLRAKGDAEGRAALLAREVVELRGEVAKFKPLEFLLLKGGDPVQHLSEAVLDLSAKLRSAEDATRIMDREYFGLNNKLREARAEIDLLKETAQASAVVVPELTTDDAHRELLRVSPGRTYSAEQADSFRDGYDFARTRAIPSDRVLGDGMVAVDRAELEALREFHDAYTEDGECDLDEFLQKLNSVSEKIAALRANQGGAAT